MLTPISQDQLSDLRAKLEKRRDQLRAMLQSEKSAPVRTESDSQDIELSYISGQDQQVEEGIDEQHARELRDIEAALQRMTASHYGICQDCGDPIGFARLSAYPMARRCIDCKQALEKEAGITRHT